MTTKTFAAHRGRKMKRSIGEHVFDAFNVLILLALCVSTLYPFLYLLKLSLSPPTVSFATVSIIPEAVSLVNFKTVLRSDYILSGFRMTVLRTVLGTGLSLLAMVMTAYPLSKKYMPHRTFYMAFIVFTMFFSGGLIPEYLLVKNLHMQDTIWALVLPGLISTYSMIIIRNFFMSIPEEINESARIDGANEIIILFRLVLPLSTPILATVLLWEAVAHWNAWFDSMIYMQDTHKHVLQMVLRRVVIEGTQQMMNLNSSMSDTMAANTEGIKAAATMVVSLPIIALYPFVQRYFVKGIMVGSLKG